MKLILAFLICLASYAQANTAIIGHWRFSEMIYHDQRIPIPNPDLNLTWTFYRNGTERLYWDRGTSDFCERISNYTVEENWLLEETYFINPRNASDCARDPDMQIGKKTKLQFQNSENELLLNFQLGEEQLIYVLKPVSISMDKSF